METLFRKVLVSERVPTEIGTYTCFLKDGRSCNYDFLGDTFETTLAYEWLEEIQIPSEEEVSLALQTKFEEWSGKGLINNLHESACYKAGIVDAHDYILGFINNKK